MRSFNARVWRRDEFQPRPNDVNISQDFCKVLNTRETGSMDKMRPIDAARRDTRSGPGKLRCAASKVLTTEHCNGAHLSVQEDIMKRIIQGLAFVALISAAHASYGSAFPADGEAVSVPMAWTFADRHMGRSGQSMGSVFPANGDEKPLSVGSTYADRHAGELNQRLGSAFPASGDEKSIPVASTYADRYARQAAQRTAARNDD